jgi:hypothetical protein
MEVGSLYLVRTMFRDDLCEHRVTFLGREEDGRLRFDCSPRGVFVFAPEKILHTEPTEFRDEWYAEPWKHNYHYKNRSLARFPKDQGTTND